MRYHRVPIILHTTGEIQWQPGFYFHTINAAPEESWTQEAHRIDKAF